ncbi:hypothetical protein A9G12_09925 [Gilliamella sp. wkB112]|nr:hypothetical protein A9G12_09925 [Gilliamella apicola]
MPAGVTISSLIYHNSDICLCFHLFVDKLSENNLAKIKELANDIVSVNLYYINDNFQINCDTLVLGYLSAMSCVRFIIPDILKNKTDKLLYIDSDILCLNPINSLYDTELGDNIAGVIPDDDGMQSLIKDLYTINYKNYFNAGVLLINVKKWVKNNITELCMNTINNGKVYRFADQDVLNILLENNTRLLPIKYNTKIHITTSCKEEKEIAPYTVLLHYVTGHKPWYQTFDSHLFKKYLSLSPWKNSNQPITLKRSWLRHYAKYCLKRGKVGTALKFYYLYIRNSN